MAKALRGTRAPFTTFPPSSMAIGGTQYVVPPPPFFPFYGGGGMRYRVCDTSGVPNIAGNWWFISKASILPEMWGEGKEGGGEDGEDGSRLWWTMMRGLCELYSSVDITVELVLNSTGRDFMSFPPVYFVCIYWYILTSVFSYWNRTSVA